MRPLRERLRDVRIAVVGLVKACAACKGEIQLLRRNPARALRGTRDGVVRRARSRERDARVVDAIRRSDILAVVRRACDGRRYKVFLAIDDTRERRAELRCVCRCRAVVGFGLRRDIGKGQRALFDRVGAADEVIRFAVRMVCADVFLCIEADMVCTGQRGAIVDLLSVLDPLRPPHQSREERRRMSLVDAPRRPLAALAGDDGFPLIVLPVLIGRRLLYLLHAAFLDVLRRRMIQQFADRTGFRWGVRWEGFPLIREPPLSPYDTANPAVIRRSHNAADALRSTAIPCGCHSLHGSRMQSVLHGTFLYRSRNAANLRSPCDRPLIADVLKGNSFPLSYNAADLL